MRNEEPREGRRSGPELPEPTRRRYHYWPRGPLVQETGQQTEDVAARNLSIAYCVGAALVLVALLYFIVMHGQMP
jgi:hypothetical protein